MSESNLNRLSDLLPALIYDIEELRTKEDNLSLLKNQILKILEENQLREFIVPFDDKMSVHVKVYKRTTKAFDKQGLLKDREESVEDFDVIKLSEMTFNRKITPDEVKKFVFKNQSKFIVARLVYKKAGD